MSNLFEVGKAYTFSVYPSNIIENVFDYAVCTATFSSDIAQHYLDITAIHAQVYSYLPSGTPDSAFLYNYVQFQLRDGSRVVLGIPWINTSTITVSDAQMITVNIRGVTANRINDIRDTLISNGFNDIEIIVVADTPKNKDQAITNNLHQP